MHEMGLGMKRYDLLIQQCDSAIRAGRTSEASKLLSAISPARVPREWRVGLAKLCRRAGLNSLGMRLLTNALRRLNEAADRPTSAELAEYSMLLLRSGAVPEALEKLGGVDTHEVPDALLYRAFGHFARWEYAAAIPHLESYLKESLTPYARLVGRTNLGSAHAECRHHDVALTILNENIRETQAGGHLQLQGNCHAFCAQVHMQNGDYKLARKEIEAAQRIFPLTQINDHFLVTRLALLLEGLETKSEAPFEKLRQLAVSKRAWGSLRDADLFSLKVRFDHVRHLHLYFGTPFAGFRERIEQELGRTPARSVYVLGPIRSPRLDLTTGKINGTAMFRTGGKCHQMLEVLLRDFYQPYRIAGLYSELFPREQYDIQSSPGRVHQLLWRTRQWLEQKKFLSIFMKSTDSIR